ncbi:acyl-homoserine-lactone synthase [Teredinibacter waterburyi]|jgi:N-acyl-L-homoserine lactone synthetase|uniref:acyl-homoserine-lactone synthase n=1 Tax=Teredinibacter waterburyi TaxID=1500538 RepID=UPI00165FFC5D|nr:acyl-homoserine-lactone synthase [Teredinibacter waterburyi]
MNTTIFTTENSADANNLSIIDGILKLRHETFIQRLDWEIPSENGRERDQFDELNPHFIAVTDETQEVKGCWRALPTTGDYMLKSIFPELLQGETAPEREGIWEISRFAVKKGSADKARGNFGNVTLDLVRSFYDFAKENNVKSYVTVTSLACERLLRQLGVNVRRMGEGKMKQIGVERTVALWIEVNDNLNIVSH